MKSDWVDTDEKRREIEQKLKTAQIDTCMHWNTPVERAEANGTKFDESCRVSTNSAKVHCVFDRSLGHANRTDRGADAIGCDRLITAFKISCNIIRRSSE